VATRAGRLLTALLAAALLGSGVPAAVDTAEPAGYASQPILVTGPDGGATDDLDADDAVAVRAVDTWWRTSWHEYFPGRYTAPGPAPAARARSATSAPSRST